MKAASPTSEDDERREQASLVWQWCAFDELSLTELYTVLQVRQMVFARLRAGNQVCGGIHRARHHASVSPAQGAGRGFDA
jgi:hypothetical protein